MQEIQEVMREVDPSQKDEPMPAADFIRKLAAQAKGEGHGTD